MLVDLARGEVHVTTTVGHDDAGGGWFSVFKQAGLPRPDAERATLGGQEFSYVWRDNRVAATVETLTEAARSYSDDMGWTLFELPQEPGADLPANLIAALKE
jgi:hypothetical protein